MFTILVVMLILCSSMDRMDDFWDMIRIWALVVVGILVLGFIVSLFRRESPGRYYRSSGRSTCSRPYRIDHPHVIENDDYECSVCHRRFDEKRSVCPYCDARFLGSVVDEEELEDEEDDLETWDEEEGW